MLKQFIFLRDEHRSDTYDTLSGGRYFETSSEPTTAVNPLQRLYLFNRQENLTEQEQHLSVLLRYKTLKMTHG